ncbi:MAG: hypothetical protein ACF8XB_07760 [Planctomycetota bacterium JB042]
MSEDHVKQLGRIEERLDSISIRLDSIVDSVARVPSLEETTRTLRHSINGNGKVGIAERLRRLEARHATASRVLWVLVTAVIGTGVTAGAAAVLSN